MAQNMRQYKYKKALENTYGKVPLLVDKICYIKLKSSIYVGKN